MSLLKEFEINNEDVSEGLMWGGITMPYVMQQKDGSCFCVIEYEPYEKNNLTKNLNLPSFCRGWAIWNERQHTLEGDRDFIILCWNPFETKINPNIENTFGEKILKENFLKYFGEESEKICKEFSKVTKAKLLEYQELMNFLSFTLTLEKVEVEMPEVPLYMDVLLSQDVKFIFKANDIFINGKKIFIVSLPDLPSAWEIFEQVKRFSYRYVRRILIFDEKESEIEMKKYCGKWCPNRKIMLEEIEKNILSNFNGYCWNGFIFLLDELEEKIFREYFEEFLQEKEISFIFEHYNLKDVWWGSLAGMYLANITPPLVGFDSVEEFILHKEKIKTDPQEHKFKKILEEMEAEKNVSNGQI
ncbi:MAG: hypothetical protein IK062_06625 [Selenomonadaceae bacterium]|nr:hypothetical protein [Selenomonadaceae bacterium]